jgi:hypothetical protein
MTDAKRENKTRRYTVYTKQATLGSLDRDLARSVATPPKGVRLGGTGQWEHVTNKGRQDAEAMSGFYFYRPSIFGGMERSSVLPELGDQLR